MGADFYFSRGHFSSGVDIDEDFNYKILEIFIFTNFFDLKQGSLVKVNFIFWEKKFFRDLIVDENFWKLFKKSQRKTNFFLGEFRRALKFLSCYATWLNSPCVLMVISEDFKKVLWSPLHVLWKIL